MSRVLSVEETSIQHINKGLCFNCSEKFLVQAYMIHGEKKNIIRRLEVLLVTTTSFSNFTYFEFSKLLELTGQNENAFLSKQIKGLLEN